MDSSDDSKGFLKHVFNFDDDSKYDILNIIQYAMIALLPVIILNKKLLVTKKKRKQKNGVMM